MSTMFADIVIAVVKYGAYAVGVGVILYIALLFFIGIGHVGKLFTVDLYRHWRYTQRGLCPKCHKPAETTHRQVDQMYSSNSSRLVCACGTTSLPMGDRHAAEW